MAKKPKVRVKINEAGINALFAEIAEKLNKLDAELRELYTGKPVEEIVDKITQRVIAAGVNTNSQHMREYAEAISTGTPFRIEVR